MRTALSNIQELRDIFRAVFVQYGTKTYKGHLTTTLLFKNITRNNELLTDHIWLAETAGFQKLDLKKGDAIEFCARVKKYKKGYVNKRIGINEQQYDYKLSHPTKIQLVKKTDSKLPGQ